MRHAAPFGVSGTRSSGPLIQPQIETQLEKIDHASLRRCCAPHFQPLLTPTPHHTPGHYSRGVWPLLISSPLFKLDESVLPTGAALHASVALKALSLLGGLAGGAQPEL